MALFKEIREFLLLSLENNIIDEKEFSQLSEEFKSKNFYQIKGLNQIEQNSSFCCPIHFTGVNFPYSPIHLTNKDIKFRIYSSLPETVYTKCRENLASSRGKHVHLKTYRQNKQCRWDGRCFERQRNIFLGIFNRLVFLIDAKSPAFRPNLQLSSREFKIFSWTRVNNFFKIKAS